MGGPLAWLDDALANLERQNLRRTLVACSRAGNGERIEVGGKSLVNFGSNDYLGLSSHPQIVAAVREALATSGWGAGASPLVMGRTSLHAELERRIAEFEAAEAALLFPTGYAANVGTIAALVGKGDAVYSDELNHASIIDGCRLSGAAIQVYRHGNPGHLEDLLGQSHQFRRRLIVSDSLFSMHGDVAPLDDLVRLSARYEAMLMVDEAHATGVWGREGRGFCEQLGVEASVPICIGTLSKALGSHGGFVAGSQQLIDWLANRARPYGFSTAAPAGLAAAALAALAVVRSEPQRRQQVQVLAQRLRDRLVAERLIHPGVPTQIVPVVLDDPARAVTAAAELRRRGFFVPAIRPPSVPEGQSLLRISLTCRHTPQQLNDLVAALVEVAR